MKLLIAILALSPVLASAEPAFYCKSRNSGPDHGLTVNFSSPIHTAEVSAQSIAGPRSLASLECSYTGQQDGVYLNCVEPLKRDAGYSLTLDNTDGAIVAKLYTISFVGSKLVATLDCGRQ